MNGYTVRVTLEHSDVNDGRCRQLVAWSKSDKAVFAKETGKETGKQHYQGLVFADSKQSLDYQVKKLFGVAGNEQYSTAKVKDLESYAVYLCKEGPFIVNGYDLEALLLKADQKKAEKVKGKREKKESTCPFTEKLVHEWRQVMETSEGEEYPSHREMYKWVCRQFIDKCKVHDSFIIDRVANVILGKFYHKEREEQVHNWERNWLEKNSLV